ncbi:hypothetical protein Pdw03_3793 [Penicillium digitatum]|uniref:Uncharacterized protein n=1 Tax=Penicillium digitatum TaxID=36651 RepID=A0A7T7BIF3_PENDI|nr:hypothetical protein Pdw03_3793 [Penicillium digitatum]
MIILVKTQVERLKEIYEMTGINWFNEEIREILGLSGQVWLSPSIVWSILENKKKTGEIRHLLSYRLDDSPIVPFYAIQPQHPEDASRSDRERMKTNA